MLSERLKMMKKWLSAQISKDDLTSLQSHDQNISEIYNSVITIMMMFLVRLITLQLLVFSVAPFRIDQNKK